MGMNTLSHGHVVLDREREGARGGYVLRSLAEGEMRRSRPVAGVNFLNAACGKIKIRSSGLDDRYSRVCDRD